MAERQEYKDESVQKKTELAEKLGLSGLFYELEAKIETSTPKELSANLIQKLNKLKADWIEALYPEGIESEKKRLQACKNEEDLSRILDSYENKVWGDPFGLE